MNDLKSIYKYNQALDLIKQASNILVATHEKPDGDALASTCALSLLLDSLNKSYTLFSPDKPSKVFSFLPNIGKVEFRREKVIQKDFSKYDLIILTDCGNIARSQLETELASRQANQILIEFDHHPRKEKQKSDLEIRLPQAASTTEVIYYLFKYNQLKISQSLADCILTGILTDTANFLYASANKETIDISSLMISKGARFPVITKNTLQNKGLEAMKLWSVVLNNLQINSKYNLAFTILTQEEKDKFSETEEALDDITNSLSNLKDVKAVFFLRQDKENLIKVSLRTNRSEINVAQIASLFGGGGHSRAAGFSLSGKIKKTTTGWKIV